VPIFSDLEGCTRCSWETRRDEPRPVARDRRSYSGDHECPPLVSLFTLIIRPKTAMLTPTSKRQQSFSPDWGVRTCKQINLAFMLLGNKDI